MLARVDVLCLDKTGTITEGSMQADRIVPAAGYTAEQMKKKIGLLMGALPDENPTAMALREFCPELTSEADIKIPFSSARKWSGVHIPGCGSLVVGASEFVLRELPEALQEEQEGFRRRSACASSGGEPGGFCWSAAAAGSCPGWPDSTERSAPPFGEKDAGLLRKAGRYHQGHLRR
ncbi:MAG: hypothetical protein V8S32_12735 [Lachnospiraceae bacterium]